jgi:hypothetical protein
VLKQWQARPLALAHIHAWLHDTLHATFYLCWWRWRRRAVAQLRWRASLGLHMYRCAGRACCSRTVSSVRRFRGYVRAVGGLACQAYM